MSADPGCGKSVLSRHLVQNILPAEQPEATVCYFFFKDTPEQRGLDSAVCSLLHGLFYEHGVVADDLEGSTEAQGRNLVSDPTSLASLFQGAASHRKTCKIICVVDALDECNPEQLHILVKLLRRLLPLHDELKPDRQRSVKFLLTTRGYPKTLDLFWDSDMSCVHLSGNSRNEKDQIQNEIKFVIDHRLRTLAKKRRLSEERQLAIREALEDVDAEQRTYLWIGLVFQVLEKNFDDRPQAWRSLIKETPSTVFHAYDKLLQYVRSQELPHVRVLFHFILAAYRALTAINTSEVPRWHTEWNNTKCPKEQVFLAYSLSNLSQHVRKAEEDDP